MSRHNFDEFETIRNNIQTVKAQLKLTNKSIAQKTGVTQATVSRYLSGTMIITDSWLKAFCDSFHVDYEWIRKGSGDPVITDTTSAIDRNDVSGAGQRLAQIRKELGLDQSQMFELLGIKRTMYSRIENGRSKLSVEHAKKIESKFGIGAKWLLYGEVGKKNYPVCERMEEWLWNHEDERARIWKMMREEE